MVGPVFYEHYNGLNKIDILDAKLENSFWKKIWLRLIMEKLLLTFLIFNHFRTVLSVSVTNYATNKWNSIKTTTTRRVSIVKWSKLLDSLFGWISMRHKINEIPIGWNKKKRNHRKKQKRNVNPPIWKPTKPTTRHRNGEKKVPNHILFKLEFMMFITNDADPPWMQMRNERAKIVPQNKCREREWEKYRNECSASAVRIFNAYWRHGSAEIVRFALNIIDFMFVFITLFSYTTHIPID